MTTTKTPILKPEITTTLSGYSYWWSDLSIRVNIERIDDDGIGELSCWNINGQGNKLLHISRANLLSTTSSTQLAKRLSKNMDIDWDTLLTFVSAMTMEEVRKGEPIVKIGTKPAAMRIDYQLYPILELNQPTTIYAPGGSAKSYLACFIACLIQFYKKPMEHVSLGWQTTPGNVLYLDWESSALDNNRRVWAIKRGLGIDNDETILYRFCSQPLVNDIYAIKKTVVENNINIVIVDSQMAASGYGPDASQLSSQFYNALRSLRCTTLTIDHVSKEDWKGLNTNSVGPYGSVVKYNRSRSQFELTKTQTAGEHFIELALTHKKHNEGMLLKPLGIRINFNNDDDGHLDNVTFNLCDLTTNPELEKKATYEQRAINIFVNDNLTINQLANRMGVDKAVVRTTVTKKGFEKGLFEKKGVTPDGEDIWGNINEEI